MHARTASSVLVAVAIAAGASGACGGASPSPSVPAKEPRVVSSNVGRTDYAGSAACAPCHAAVYEAWRSSPMRRMTRRAEPGAITAPFDGTRFAFKDDALVMFEEAGRKYVRVESPRGEKLYRVTKVIGGRYREDFVGVEVRGTGASERLVGRAEDEPVLPISYLKFEGTWRYKGYSVMLNERPRIERGAEWRRTCIFCHNTAPFLATVYDDLLGGGSNSYQGSISDDLLPQDKRLSFRVGDDERLGRVLADEVRFLGGRARDGAGRRELLQAAIASTRERFDESHLVEIGIGCEACHGGSKEHVRDPRRKPSFEPRSAYLSVSGGGAGLGRAELVNRTCARCHTVLFSRYPFTWEGGHRKSGSPGGSSINSGEARDYLLGGCSAKMACTACHDPHGEDSRQKLDALGTVRGNGVCTACHGQYAGRDALAAHTHHAPEGEGSACVACHMPKKNAGLGYELTRYHRIGSPTDAARVLGDRPLECALCHADKSVESLVASMEGFWKKRYDRDSLERLYGDLGDNAIAATLVRGKPHEQITAAGVLGDRRPENVPPALLLPLFTAKIPLVRHYARAAAEKVTKRKVAVDLNGDAATIERDARRWLSPP